MSSFISATDSVPTQSSLNDTKQQLGKSPYLGDYKWDYGSIIDFYLFWGVAGESVNQTQRICKFGNKGYFKSNYFNDRNSKNRNSSVS